VALKSKVSMRVPFHVSFLAVLVDALAAKVESLILEVAGAKGQGTFYCSTSLFVVLGCLHNAGHVQFARFLSLTRFLGRFVCRAPKSALAASGSERTSSRSTGGSRTPRGARQSSYRRRGARQSSSRRFQSEQLECASVQAQTAGGGASRTGR
jgi:hypothetical protein